MTTPLNHDSTAQKTGTLPFEPGALDRCGLRLTRAEFARFLGVSKQAVGEWVTAGKITLGADGRLDPRQAVSQLLRNTNPSRLRSKVLAPLMRDIGTLQQQVDDLSRKLAAASSDAEFHEESALELIRQWDSLECHLGDERDVLESLPSGMVVEGVIEWMNRVANDRETAETLTIIECVSVSDDADQDACAPGNYREGGR